MEVTESGKIKNLLRGLQPNETFAAKTERPWGATYDYCVVSRQKNPDVGNGFVEVERYKNPSEDFSEKWSLKHGIDNLDISSPQDGGPKSTETGIWLTALGRNPQRVEAVTTEIFTVNFEPNATIGIQCSECGQEFTKHRSNPPEENSDGTLRTPCCNTTDWETILVTD